MRVCLIRPSVLVPRHNQTAMFTPPLGVAYLAGSMIEAGLKVSVIDGLGAAIDTRHAMANDCCLYGLPLDQIVDRVPEDAAIIGVSADFTFAWPTCVKLLAGLRDRFADRILVAGGEHITAMPERSLAGSALDIAVLGEGEETMVEIARACARGRLDPALIAGIAYKAPDGDIVVNPRRPRIRAIDDIPWPAWELLPVEAYLDRGLGFGVNRGRSMPLLASRGCPYRCTFCSSPEMWTTRWLARDPDKLLDELEYQQRRYAATNFDFYDLTTIIKKSWIVAFCDKVAERKLSFTWQLPSGTRSEAIDGDVARLLYRSGCRNLSYAPESGSPAVLRRIKKKIEPDRMIESMRSSVGAGLNVKCNIMLGFPGESVPEVWQTFRFIARMAVAGAHDLSIVAFSPYPGSELFAELESRGAVVVDDRYYDSLRSYADFAATKSYSEHIGSGWLKLLRALGMALFYVIAWGRRPTRPFRVAYNLLRGRHESRTEMVLVGLLRRMQMARSG